MDKLYRVQFTFQSNYNPKQIGPVSITLVTLGSDQFTALQSAWASLSALNLPEPLEFEAKRVDSKD